MLLALPLLARSNAQRCPCLAGVLRCLSESSVPPPGSKLQVDDQSVRHPDVDANTLQWDELLESKRQELHSGADDVLEAFKRQVQSTETTAKPHQEESPRLASEATLQHPKYGYAVLGGVNPEARAAGAGETPRVHPTRLFRPGETYEAEDLNPFYEEAAQTRRAPQLRRMPSSQEARTLADYKNVEFLEQFVSDTGRLLPRRVTRLKPKVHRYVMRQIKLARVMALMPHELRYEESLVSARAREFEAAQFDDNLN